MTFEYVIQFRKGAILPLFPCQIRSVITAKEISNLVYVYLLLLFKELKKCSDLLSFAVFLQPSQIFVPVCVLNDNRDQI